MINRAWAYRTLLTLNFTVKGDPDGTRIPSGTKNNNKTRKFVDDLEILK